MEKILNTLPFWNNLNDREKDLVRSSAVVRKFNTGELVHTCNKQCVGLVYVISGNLRLYLLSDEGKEITLAHILKNETCVLSASCIMSQITFHTELTASENTEIMIIPAAIFAGIIKTNIFVRCNMYESSTRLFSDTMWVIQQILFHSIDKRLATFLLSEYEKSGSDTLNITQENIAVEINTAREVVARMLKRFASEGYIHNQRGKIVLINLDALEEISS